MSSENPLIGILHYYFGDAIDEDGFLDVESLDSERLWHDICGVFGTLNMAPRSMGFKPDRSEEAIKKIQGLNSKLVGGAVKWDEELGRWKFKFDE